MQSLSDAVSAPLLAWACIGTCCAVVAVDILSWFLPAEALGCSLSFFLHVLTYKGKIYNVSNMNDWRSLLIETSSACSAAEVFALQN